MSNLWAKRDSASPPDCRFRRHLEGLTSTRCRFIEGESTADALYCGPAVETGKPWCLFHARIAYQRPAADPWAINPTHQRAPAAV